MYFCCLSCAEERADYISNLGVCFFFCRCWEPIYWTYDSLCQPLYIESFGSCGHSKMQCVADGKANVIYNYQLFYFWAFCPIRMGVFLICGARRPFCTCAKFFIFFRLYRETLQSCNVLCVERNLNGLSDHTFKLPERTTNNKIFVIEVSGGRFASLYPTDDTDSPTQSHGTYRGIETGRPVTCARPITSACHKVYESIRLDERKTMVEKSAL